MDLVLNFCDDHFFSEYAYPSWIATDSIWRQYLSLFVILTVGAFGFYFTLSGLVYFFLFDKTIMKHPLYIENQVVLEIKYTCHTVPIMAFMTASVVIFEVRGYARLYDNISDSSIGWWSIPLQVLTFLLFTDCLIYWIHRGLHHRLIYKHIHKGHHKWKVTTPFASHAFHPLDGFLQSVPYHLYVFLFPCHKLTYLILFVLVNVWTVSIHDGNYKVPRLLRPFINGSAHHTDHHLYYNYNYGQYLTLWDRLCGSFRHPSALEGKGPLEVAMTEMKGAQGNGEERKEK